MLEVGTKAPDFELPDQDGALHKLSDYIGKKVILYFYPKDSTPGCTKQACAFAGAYESFKDNDIVVIGISKDSVASHKKFAEKHGLPFTLLADTGTEMLQAFGAWGEKKMYGKTVMGTLRTTFIFDEAGILREIIEKVDTKNHAGQILK